MTRSAIAILFASTVLFSRDTYPVAGGHYHPAFENPCVRAPHETAPVHNHPPNPVTLYVYVTGFTIDRKPVKAGAIRVAHGAPESHTVTYLGDEATGYARIELRTEPLDRPARDVRQPPFSFDKPSAAIQQFENGQLRVARVLCAAGQQCPGNEHPGDPAVVVVLSGPRRGGILWSPQLETGPMEQVRIELRSRPAAK